MIKSGDRILFSVGTKEKEYHSGVVIGIARNELTHKLVYKIFRDGDYREFIRFRKDIKEIKK